MKKLVLFILMFFVVSVFAQDKKVTITMKNGSTITGKMMSFDPASHIEIEIAGFSSRIDMSDIEKISELENSRTENIKETSVEMIFPKDTIINIAGIDVKFILIDGGTFQYGYDGRHSRALNSEPVHDVTLSSFYISEYLISTELVNAVMRADLLTPKNFKVNMKNIEDLYGLAFMSVDDKNKKHPFVGVFLQAVKQYLYNLDIPTEIQFFIAHSGGISGTTKLAAEIVTEVSMSDMRLDPKGSTYRIMGCTFEKADLRLYDRNFIHVYGIFNNFVSYSTTTPSPCAPFRLVFIPK